MKTQGNPVRLDSFYSKSEVEDAKQAVKKDARLRSRMREDGLSFEDLVTTTMPLKYLGIEEKTKKKHRFKLEDAIRLSLLSPRLKDGDSRGLRRSNHRKAFRSLFKDLDDMLSDPSLKELALRDDKSEYASRLSPILKKLHKRTGIPPSVSLKVMKKGIGAFYSGHRPGMSAHGWARARLTSFVMKGCTHYFPDHKLVERAYNSTSVAFWNQLPCLCHKRKEQCEKYGVRTSANITEKTG